MAFQGYTQQTVDFMWGIRFNNERPWFEAHKETYLSELYRPMKDLGAEIYDFLSEQRPDDPMVCRVSRIYRDARRLHGRGPYKDHLWFCVRAGGEDWTGRPTFYFEIGPDYYSYGMGFWAPKAALMEAYRKAVDEHPEVLEKLVKRFNKQAQFTLSGPEYARKKTAPSPLLAAWYNKKSINLQHDAAPDERMFSQELAQDIIEGFRTLMPLYKYFDALCAAEMV